MNIIKKLIERGQKHKLIFNHYGRENQINKLVEEIGELEEAIFNHDRLCTDETLDHMCEKMADVFNVLSQFFVIDREVRKVSKFKLKRTMDIVTK